MALGGLLAHEFAHSWNGKYPPARRPRLLPTSRSRWRPTCCGVMRDSPTTLAPCSPRAAACGHRISITSTSRASPPPSDPDAPAALGVRCSDTADRRARARLRARLDELASRHGLLRRRRSPLARSRDHHSSADPTARNRSTISATPSTAAPNNGPQVKTYTFDQLMSSTQCHRPIRLGSLLPQTARLDRERGARRRNRKRRMEGRLQRQAAETRRPPRKFRRSLLHRPAGWSGRHGRQTRSSAAPHSRPASHRR